MSLTIQYRTIQSPTTGNIEIIRLAGRLVFGEGTSSLRDTLRNPGERKTDILVDLSGVSYVDSAGLGELVAGYAFMTSRGLRMKLLRPTARVDSLLHITKLYSTFEVFWAGAHLIRPSRV